MIKIEELLKQLLDEFGIMKTEFSKISSNMATKSDIKVIKNDLMASKSDIEIIKKDQITLKSDIEDIKRDQMASKSDIEVIKRDQITSKSDIEVIKRDLHEIKESVHHIEQSQPDDIYALLKTIADKLDNRDSKIQVL